MTDKKVLITPEQGETKEQFKARLKAALGVAEADGLSGAVASDETTEAAPDPREARSGSDARDLAQEWKVKILKAFPRGFRVTSELTRPRYIENRAFHVSMDGFTPVVNAYIGPEALKDFQWRLESVMENADGSWDVTVPYETQRWTPLTDEEYGPVIEEWDRFFHERNKW
jgi:hypothetical protein